MIAGADDSSDVRGEHSLTRRHLKHTDQCNVLKKADCLTIYMMASYLYNV